MVGDGSTTTTGSGGTTSSGPLHQPSFAGEETIDVQLLLEGEEPSSSSFSPLQALLVDGSNHEMDRHRHHHRHIITARCIHHHHPIRTHNDNNNENSDGGIFVTLELSPDHGITAPPSG